MHISSRAFAGNYVGRLARRPVILVTAFLLGLIGTGAKCKKSDSSTLGEAPKSDCSGGYAHGATFTRTRYSAETAVIGLGTCSSEEQSCSCDNGTTTCSGTYTAETCSSVTASITGGDILLVRERQGGGSDSTFAGGAIIAFSSSGAYKGVAVVRDASNEVLRYPRGMKLEKDTLDDDYHLIVGTTNSSLEMEVHRSSTGLVPGSSQVLSPPAKVSNSGSYPSSYFDFGFTENRNQAQRYIAEVNTGTSAPKIYMYYSGGAANSCDVDYGSGYAGWKINAMWTGMYTFSSHFWVARTHTSNGYAIDKITNCQDGGSDPTIPGTPEISASASGLDWKISDVFELLDSTGSWHQNVFVTRMDRLGDAAVVRYHTPGSWTLDSDPFTARAYAAYYVSNGGTGKSIYTLEADGSGRYLRRYSSSGVLEATLYTDTTGAVLPAMSGGLGYWLVVVPSS